MELTGVSCVSRASCMAVGSVNWGTTLAERWDGRRWSRVEIPNPSRGLNGRNNTYLHGVSCASSTSCTAVGGYDYYAEHVKAGTLVERWDGTSWAIQASADPPAGGALVGVSCLSDAFCAAGGYVEAWDFARALAERWEGTSWTIQPTPQPPISRVLDVSCTSPIACTAVGSFQLELDVYPWTRRLVERWDGSRWSLERTATPSGASAVPGYSGSGLAGISCTPAVSCIAVGWYANHAGRWTALIEHRGAAGWTVAATPAAPGETRSQLAGVSCAAGICTAVGEYDDENGDRRPLVLSTAGPWLTPASAEVVGIPVACTQMLLPRVQGRGISAVSWRLDGGQVPGRTVHPGTMYTTSVPLTPGPHRLTARVRFVAGSQADPRTFREAVAGCLPPPLGRG